MSSPDELQLWLSDARSAFYALSEQVERICLARIVSFKSTQSIERLNIFHLVKAMSEMLRRLLCGDSKAAVLRAFHKSFKNVQSRGSADYIQVVVADFSKCLAVFIDRSVELDRDRPAMVDKSTETQLPVPDPAYFHPDLDATPPMAFLFGAIEEKPSESVLQAGGTGPEYYQSGPDHKLEAPPEVEHIGSNVKATVKNEPVETEEEEEPTGLCLKILNKPKSSLLNELHASAAMARAPVADSLLRSPSLLKRHSSPPRRPFDAAPRKRQLVIPADTLAVCGRSDRCCMSDLKYAPSFDCFQPPATASPSLRVAVPAPVPLPELSGIRSETATPTLASAFTRGLNAPVKTAWQRNLMGILDVDKHSGESVQRQSIRKPKMPAQRPTMTRKLRSQTSLEGTDIGDAQLQFGDTQRTQLQDGGATPTSSRPATRSRAKRDAMMIDLTEDDSTNTGPTPEDDSTNTGPTPEDDSTNAGPPPETICAACGINYGSHYMLKLHHKTVHWRIKCPMCQYPFRSEANLKLHLNNVHQHAGSYKKLTKKT